MVRSVTVVVVVPVATAVVSLHPEVMVRGGYVRLEAVLQLILQYIFCMIFLIVVESAQGVSSWVGLTSLAIAIAINAS